MSTHEYLTPESQEIIESRVHSTIETARYGNNVQSVMTLIEAYELARQSPGTIELTGMPIYQPMGQGLPINSNVLLFNDGAVVGRCAAARRILGEPEVEKDDYSGKLREAIFNTRNRKLYHSEALIGLEKDFMVKAHLLIPQGHENILYNWLLNFQYLNNIYTDMYNNSREYPEADIYIFGDPEWSHPDHPLGLSFFDPENNCAAILGMKYFGEFKKGTLTLAWGTAVRNGFVACHGGLKRYNLDNGDIFVAAVFGLSGSGKSTITHSDHDKKYNITVLHDDAFIINSDEKFAIALEPSYFDKTTDYPLGSADNKFILTAQNNGVTKLQDGKLYMMTEDIRNGNGRAIKSKLWSPTRVDRIDEEIDAIFWLMKDPTLPPVLKFTDPVLASTMGATLATKRTSAERLAPGVDPDALVIEPYANPFRTYPLGIDYEKFKDLIESGVACYALNTGDFMGKNITKDNTLSVLESIIEDRTNFKEWGKMDGIEIMEVEGFIPDLSDEDYKGQFKSRFKDRIDFIEKCKVDRGGRNALPEETEARLKDILKKV
jgi:phosphoenolpyruvate carboxykinase (ATP)